MAVCPVTQGEYTQVTGVNPSRFSAEQMDGSAFSPPLSGQQRAERELNARQMAGKDTTRHPVEMVSWDDCTEFCRWLSLVPEERVASRGYRLPTEAEWEYACRAGTGSRWSWGDDAVDLVKSAWFKENSGSTTHPVGQKQPNAWGLYDMYGNVWQWCADWSALDYYRQSPLVDPKGPAAGSARVMRGGSQWRAAFRCLSASRSHWRPANRMGDIGFRVVVEVPAKERVGTQMKTSVTASKTASVANGSGDNRPEPFSRMYSFAAGAVAAVKPQPPPASAAKYARSMGRSSAGVPETSRRRRLERRRAPGAREGSGTPPRAPRVPEGPASPEEAGQVSRQERPAATGAHAARPCLLVSL